MPRSEHVVIALALGVGSISAPDANAQPRPSRATEAILRQVETAERRKLKGPTGSGPFDELPAPEPSPYDADIPASVLDLPIPGPHDLLDGHPTRAVVLFRPDQFDHAVFSYNNADAPKRIRLEKMLAAEIERAGWDSPLTEPQKATLRLAGRGDIKRFFDRVDRGRGRCGRSPDATMEMDAFRGLMEEMQALRSDYMEGPFGRGSLFAKALHSIRRKKA